VNKEYHYGLGGRVFVNYLRPAWNTSTVASVVNKLDYRWVLLTALSTCRGEFFQVQSLGHSFRGKYHKFWKRPKCPKFPYSSVPQVEAWKEVYSSSFRTVISNRWTGTRRRQMHIHFLFCDLSLIHLLSAIKHVTCECITMHLLGTQRESDSQQVRHRSTRWFIITGTPTKSGISLLLGHTCGYNLAWLSPR